jgi:hypothetical protein
MSAADQLSAALSQSYDALESMTSAVNLAREKFTAMQDALRTARRYVDIFEPSLSQEYFNRSEMLQLIDKLAPPIPPPMKFCTVDNCCLPEGHEGDHDALPF